MACSCGGNRFVARQICRHDVVVDDNNDFLEKCGEGDQDIYDAEHPFGPFTCLKCETVWDNLPTYKAKRMRIVEMALLRRNKTWDLVAMLVPEEEFLKVEKKSEGDTFWFSCLMKERLIELVTKLRPDDDIIHRDVFHIEDDYQDGMLEGGPCLL